MSGINICIDLSKYSVSTFVDVKDPVGVTSVWLFSISNSDVQQKVSHGGLTTSGAEIIRVNKFMLHFSAIYTLGGPEMHHHLNCILQHGPAS